MSMELLSLTLVRESAESDPHFLTRPFHYGTQRTALLDPRRPRLPRRGRRSGTLRTSAPARAAVTPIACCAPA
jgi:hypothetical protein